ncbi:MAG: protocatechuate 3,4-dioxygenase [Verrucomicrobiales bacterium]
MVNADRLSYDSMSNDPNDFLIETWDRRKFITGLGLGASAFLTAGAYAEQLSQTPRQTEGPFYPNKMPLDTDNDLLIITDSTTPAAGEVTHLSGIVRNVKSEPVRNALVEIWQVGAKGAYLHTGDKRHEMRDQSFQGYGRFLTDSKGRYYFRTVKPFPYPGRTPHIHVAVSQKGKRMLTTQCYVKAEKERNAKDGLYKRIGADGQKLVTVPFKKMRGVATGELTARWDIVIGLTPED